MQKGTQILELPACVRLDAAITNHHDLASASLRQFNQVFAAQYTLCMLHRELIGR